MNCCRRWTCTLSTALRRWPVQRIRCVPIPRSALHPDFPTSYGGAFSNLFNSSFPDKGVGVNLNIPLRNRQVQADQVRSDLEYRQAQMSSAADREHHSCCKFARRSLPCSRTG